MFAVHITTQARKEYQKLSARDQERALLAFDQLRNNPFVGKKLNGEHDGDWAYRIWPYRIIYTINKKIITVTVVAIGQRKDVYRRLRK